MSTCASAALLLTLHAHAQPPAVPVSASEAEARAILTHMAEFLASTQRFSVTLNAAYDAVQDSGEKIEFNEQRSVTLKRPDSLRVEGESSDGAAMLTVFDGREITLVDGASNVYATAPQPGGLDDTVVYFVRDLHMRLPLAVLLLSRLPAEMQSRVRSVDYVESITLRGVRCHHLAARTDAADFQLWVAEGDRPLPQRVVITYKHAAGQPQFRADLSEWNLAPRLSKSTFAARVPKGTQKVAFAAQLAHQVVPERAPSADTEGAK